MSPLRRQRRCQDDRSIGCRGHSRESGTDVAAQQRVHLEQQDIAEVLAEQGLSGSGVPGACGCGWDLTDIEVEGVTARAFATLAMREMRKEVARMQVNPTGAVPTEGGGERLSCPAQIVAEEDQGARVLCMHSLSGAHVPPFPRPELVRA
jgi:hypothetical protein